jgi:glutamate synthase (NADPH/NADH) small chain
LGFGIWNLRIKMGDPRGFLKFKRQTMPCRAVCERIKDYAEVSVLCSDEHYRQQASRCMDCGVPFCHWGCPVGNYIPEWNDLMSVGQWQKAFDLLSATNNFPEITGRICSAPCEYACVLGINDEPVTIRDNELSIIEYAFKNGFVKPNPPKQRTAKKIAIVGSGPAALACADQLNKAGHNVMVFEKDDAVGGIMRWGIPDFKLEKCILDRRLKLLRSEGIKFKTSVEVGVDVSVLKLKKEFDAVVLAAGSRTPRDLKIEGRDLFGIHFAMDYLIEANKRVFQMPRCPDTQKIDAKGKRVVVIGGGDTGSDCVGTAHRQGALSVTQIEILPRPPEYRPAECPWPKYPALFKTSTSHEEGGERKWSILTKKFIGDSGRVKKLSCVKAVARCSVPLHMEEIPGSEFHIDADLVILALGFLHPEKKGLIQELGVELDHRGNVKTVDNYMTSINGVFSCGDMHRGQSLIVWAIFEGRQAAYYINSYLRG